MSIFCTHDQRTPVGHEESANVALQRQRLDWILNCGYRAFPVRAGAKAPPLLMDNLNQASSDPAVLAQWAAKHPDCNFGLVMGHGNYCLDVDHHRPEENGAQSLKAIRKSQTQTFAVDTPGKGVHYYFHSADSNYRAKKIGPGLDFLGDGAYCLSPYSRIEGKGIYVPRDEGMKAAGLPAWLTERLTQREEGVRKSIGRQLVLDTKTLSVSETASLDRNLRKISPALDRNPWRNVIYAACNVWGNSAQVLERLEGWSRNCPEKWDGDAFLAVVASWDPDHREKLGIPFIRRMGTENPARPSFPIAVQPRDEEAVAALTDSVTSEAERMLRDRGNEPTAAHRSALHSLARAMVRGLHSTDRFRKAYPLPTGTGKTTLCVALCKVVHDSRLPKSVGLYVETIEQADELRKALIAAGVAEASIGLLHSKTDHPEAPSIAVDDAHKYRFLIACHARAKSRTKYGGVEKLLTFENRGRDLILWDESMIGANGYHEDRADVLTAIDAWLRRYTALIGSGFKSVKYADEGKKFVEFLSQAVESIESVEAGVIELPVLQGDLSIYRHLIKNVMAGSRSPMLDSGRVTETLEKVLEYTQRGRVRVVKASFQGIVLVQFENAISDEYERVIILDASAPIRELIDYDESIQVEAIPIAKDYRAVVLRVADVLSSKDSFTRKDGHLDRYLAELATLLTNTIPRQDDVLIVCHQGLEAAVADFVVQCQKERHGTLHTIHWGQHKAVNTYAECKWTITLGVLYLPPGAIASRIIGQTGNLAYGLNDAEIQRVQWSEQADMLYQAFSRGHSRVTVDGKAGEQTIYLFHPSKDMEHVMPLLQEVMPGVTVEEYKPVHLKRETKNTRPIEEVAGNIERFLVELPSTAPFVSAGDVAIALGYDTRERAWRDGWKMAMRNLVGWTKVGRRFVRRTHPIGIADLEFVEVLS